MKVLLTNEGAEKDWDKVNDQSYFFTLHLLSTSQKLNSLLGICAVADVKTLLVYMQTAK